jgi:hypothetical protein
VDQLHGDERRFLGLVDLEDGGDVGMVKGGGRLRLLDETALSLGIGAEFGRKDLVPLRDQLGVDRSDSVAQLFEDAVVREGALGHTGWILCAGFSEGQENEPPTRGATD